jgi:CRP/FNR family transcriptional regulator, cyclic AMP receptor protein
VGCEHGGPEASLGDGSQHAELTPLRTSPLLGHLDADDLTLLLAGGRAIEGNRGHLLARADDDVAVIVVAGVVAAGFTGANGAEVITELLGAGATWGLAGVIGHVRSNAEVRALVPAKVLTLPGPSLRGAILDHATISRACLRAAAAELGAVREDVERLAGTSVSQRVLLRLLELAERWGEPVRGGVTQITLSLTQEQLAAWAHVSRESLAKVLHDLRAARLVETGPRCLAIRDLTRLRDVNEAALPRQDPVQRLLGELP